MSQMVQLATQYSKNYQEQWQLHSQDITVSKRPGRFTYLAENQTRLTHEYTTLYCATIMRISYYDGFCAERNLAYSDNWNYLLTELRHGYLSGLSALANSLGLE